MSVRTLKTETATSYFCTITNKDWLPLFECTNFYDKIYSWFDFLKKRGDQIIGYTIMPNHLYVIIYLKQESPMINDVIGEAKRLMSYSIVSKLKKVNATHLLKKIGEVVTEYEKKKGIKHKVFEDSFDGKECFSYDFIQTKLQYIHNNPVKAGLIKFPEEFIHSSARFYLTGQHSIYPVIHFFFHRVPPLVVTLSLLSI